MGNASHQNRHPLKVPACCAPDWRTTRKSGRECRTSWPLATATNPLWARRRWPPPWSRVSRTSTGRVPETVDCAPGSGSCSSISATWTATGTGSCLLEETQKKRHISTDFCGGLPARPICILVIIKAGGCVFLCIWLKRSVTHGCFWHCCRTAVQILYHWRDCFYYCRPPGGWTSYN